MFVYGTLMPGHGNHSHIARFVHSAEPGTIQGILADLSAFPALVPGQGIVQGVLLRIEPTALPATDRIEGVHADVARSMYLRRRVQVTVEGGETVNAWTYEWARPANITDRPRLVVGHINGVAIHAWNPRC